jgi:proteasome lid subunit RPN8/RPN11
VNEQVGMRDAALAAAIAHARDACPHECCGLLLGRGDQVVEAFKARNLAERPASTFLIAPEDHFAARRAARERGLDLVGFYHSHPGTVAEPSDRDRKEFTYDGHLYLIVSLRADPVEVRLFRYDSGNFRQLSFVTVA